MRQEYTDRFVSNSSKYRKIFALILLFLLICYCTYQILNGNRGVLKLFEITDKHRNTSIEIDKLEREKKLLEKNVEMLKHDSLDLDLLEEQVRKNLGYGTKKETVYIE